MSGFRTMNNNIDIALFEVAEQCFGVPCCHVVNALVEPADLTRIPRTQGALYGVVSHRGQMVPVIDLAQWMGRPATHPGQAVPMTLLVLRANSKLLAVRVDAVKGLLRTTDDAVHPVCHDRDSTELFHSVVEVGGGKAPLALLDPLRLAALTHIWSDVLGPGGTSGQEVQALPGRDVDLKPTPVCAVLRVGGQLLALPAEVIGEVAMPLPIQAMAGLGGGFLGMARWRDHDVPVVDLSQMLGLPALDRAQPSWLLVLSLADRQLAFGVQDLVSVGSFPAASVQTEVALSSALQAVASGSLLDAEGARIYLLDAQKLIDLVPLSHAIAKAKSAQRQSAVSPLLIKNHSAASTGSWVVFHSGQLWAAPMLQLREIIRPSDSLRQQLREHQTLPGALEWREQSLPLVDMRLAQGQAASQDSAELRIMVLQAAVGLRAVLVERVVELIPGHAGSRFSFRVGGSEVDSVSVGTGSEHRSYRVFEASRLFGEA
ncbi:chemotaxis protein CheW [Rhodoferax fermentans]|nr:chemotaxis protein CheW [Rhodoferax fermentans]